MLRNTTRNLLLATCIAAVPSIALAQTQTPQRAPTQTAASASQMSGKFLSAPLAGQIRAEDLREADIYTADNQKVGDIDDILLDSRGNIVAVVVGVGGFLGIGEKNVAIPFESLDMMATNTGMATSGTSTMGTASNAPANSAANRDRMATGNVPSTNMGATDQDRQRATAQRAETMSQEQANQQRSGTPTAPANSRMAQNTTGSWKPERILLKGVTKAELQAAPAFNWNETAARSNTTNAPSRNR